MRARIILLIGIVLLGLDVHSQNKSQTADRFINFTQRVSAKEMENIAFSPLGLRLKQANSSGYLISKKLRIPIGPFDPFLSFAAVCEGKNLDEGKFDVLIRTSTDARKWTSWLKMQADEHSNLDNEENAFPQRFVFAHQFYDLRIKYIQYKIEVYDKDLTLKSLKLHFFSPGNVEIQPEAIEMLEPVSCPCPTLPYINRVGWNCPDGENYPVNPITTVTHMVVHHAAGFGNPPYGPQVLAVWDLHVNGNGWDDIGYNWLIAPDGTLYKGRAWNGSNDNVVGAHMCSCNANKMGVCLLGDFTSTTPTAAAYNTLKQLLGWKACSFNINPTGSSSTSIKTCCPNTNCSCTSSTVNNILGHRDGCANCTTCPGDAFYPQISTLRSDVQSFINSCGNTTPNLTRLTESFSTSSNTLTINTTIQNNGTATAGASTTQFGLSLNSNFSTLDYLIGTQNIGSIVAGGSSSQTKVIDLCTQGVPNGTYYLGYYIDYPNSVAESDETDNGWWYWSSPAVTVNCSGCAQPSNDGCSGGFNATALSFGSTCNPISSTSCGATSSGFSSCVGTQDDDVFFSFVPTSSSATVTVVSSAGYDAVFQVLTGPCGGAMTQLACIDNTNTGGTETTQVTGLSIGTTYFIRVWDYFTGYGTTGNFTICVYGCAVPSQPGTIAGNASPCQGTSQSYSISSVSGASSYTWTVPSGWSITAGQGTTNITASVGASSGQICVTASNTCGDGTPACKSVTVSQTPGTPNISGASSTCQNTTITYTATSSNATGFNWTIPSGWTLVQGQGTSSIIVTVGANSGQICVTPSNACGNGTAGCLTVTVSPIPGTASVSGPTNPCQNSNVSYTATAPNGSTYTWFVPSGWTITSGQGTATVNVTVGANSGQMCATPTNACGNGTQGCMSVTVSQVPGVATVSGNNSPCQSTSVTYTASASNATGYNWTVPSGWTINSGQGTSSVNVTVGASSGQVCATPTNSCGNGTQGCFTVTVGQLPGTAVITGSSTPCSNTTITYTATSSNATGFNWTIPSGWTLVQGQGTSSIIVTVGANSGQICVTPSNACGNGTAGCQTVTVSPIPGTASVSGPTNPCQNSNVSYTASAPNGSTYTWFVPSGWTITSGQGTATVNVTVGANSGQMCATPTNNCGNGTQGCMSVTVSQAPGVATVSGNSSPCQSTSVTYTASASNATGYNWTVPSGWTINSGQGTSTVNVTVGASSGQVCATPANSCGNGTQGCFTVTVGQLPGTVTISGSASPCQNANITYTASASNTSNFAWTVPSGWTINSGQGTSSITVTVGSTSGQVCATPSNNCGSGTPGCKTVSVILATGDATVSGPSTPCQNTNVAYTATAANATDYNWTVPSGWIITSGQGTSTINVTVGATSGQVCATPSNSCGNGAQGCKSVTVSQSAGAASVSGSTTACQGTTASYTASANNATNFNWTVPSGWTIVSGQSSSSITVTVGANTGQICATPSNSCGNGTAGCLSVTVSPLPGNATVNGSTSPCQNTNITYSATSSNATSFTWTVPSGWNINSGQGTATINVTVGANAGQVCATPSNSCGNGTQGCLTVTVQQAPGAATISGLEAPCQGSSTSYTASAGNATGYNWTVPSGWTITSGQGTSTINVTVGANSGQVCATPSNTCGNGTQGCKSVTVSQACGAASVSGSTTPCQGATVSYTASANNATNFNWTVPSGWTIVSGQNSSGITVTVGANSGQICVTPSNSCGNGTAGCLAAAVSPLPSNANITGASTACQGTTSNFTASANNAASYTWTVPSGWTINSGQGTATINVTVGANSGQVCATPTNSCGNGAQACKTVTVTQLPGDATINGQTSVCQNSNASYTAAAGNATAYDWTVPSGWTINSGQGTATINVTAGNNSGQVCATPSNNCGNGSQGCLSVIASQACGAASINGSNAPCENASITYTASASNATNFTWTVPSGWIITAGQGTASIMVTVGANSGQVCVTPSNGCGNGTQGCVAVSVIQAPGSAIISGAMLVCENTAISYAASASNATAFTWTIPSGWVINSGQGTSSINVTPGSNPGQVCVTPSNNCGSGVQVCKSVAVALFPGAANITGATSPCQNSTISYSAVSVGALGFNWTVPSGWTINSGQGTSTLNVTVGANSGQVCVTPTNACGNGTQVCQPVAPSQATGAASVSGTSTPCQNATVTYTATAPNATTYNWTVPNGWVINSGQGTSTLNVTVGANSGQVCVVPSSGCGNGLQGCVSVVVKPAPALTLTPTSVTICAGGNTQLSAGNATSYAWTPTTGLSNPNIPDPVASPTVTTVYTVTGTTDGCSATATAQVSVNPAPNITITGNAGICTGASTQLSASGASSYLWIPGTGLSNPNIANPVASPTATTTYIVLGTSNGCSGTSTITVTVTPVPTISITGNQNICTGNSTQLMASGASDFSWTPATGLNNPNIPNPVASPTTTTTYTVTGTTSGCSNTASITVNVSPTLSISVSGDTSICSGASTQLTATGGASYNWAPVTGLDNPNIANPVASPAATTTYTVLATASGCTGTTTVTVHVDPTPSISIAGNTSICAGGSTGLNASGATTYQWTPATGLNNPNIANPTASPATNTTYTVTGTANGCSATATVTITVSTALPQPGPISGPSPVCSGTIQTYTVDPVAGATSYTWTLPWGGQGASTTNVLTTTIGAQGGNLLVVANNGCGTSPEQYRSVTVKPTPPKPVITQIDSSLISSAISGNQWFFDSVAIPGANGQIYIPTATGNYNVQVDLIGCPSVLSFPFYYEYVSATSQGSQQNRFLIYPNPNNGNFVIESENDISNALLSIYNSLGELVYQDKLYLEKTEVNLGEMAKGLYVVQIVTTDERYVLAKLVIQ